MHVNWRTCTYYNEDTSVDDRDIDGLVSVKIYLPLTKIFVFIRIYCLKATFWVHALLMSKEPPSRYRTISISPKKGHLWEVDAPALTGESPVSWVGESDLPFIQLPVIIAVAQHWVVEVDDVTKVVQLLLGKSCWFQNSKTIFFVVFRFFSDFDHSRTKPTGWMKIFVLVLIFCQFLRHLCH